MTFGKLPVAAVGLAVALTMATGCGSSDAKPASTKTTTVPGPSGSITVLAAASLTEAFTAEKTAFEHANPKATVSLSFGASSALVQQVQSGAPADVIATADTTSIAPLTTAGLIGATTTIARNRLEILVPANNPANIKTLADVAKPGVKLDLCAVQVPCGKFAAQILSAAKLSVTPVSYEQDVKGVVTKVTTGEVDAGIVYVTDGLAAGSQAQVVPIPTAQNAIATYPAAVVKATANSATAQAFVAFVASPAGEKVLKARGFLPPQ
jgi:molybdate transport system substrate-binding protein